MEGSDMKQAEKIERDFSARSYFWTDPEKWWRRLHPDTDYAIVAAIHEVANLTGRRKGDIHSHPTPAEYDMVLAIASDLPIMSRSFQWAGKTISREEAENAEFQS